MVIDDNGRVINPKFRDYHLPSFADVPRTEVLFAETSDTLGPMGAKSMSESPYNPVAAALGNAIAERDRHPLHGDAVQAGPAVSRRCMRSSGLISSRGGAADRPGPAAPAHSHNRDS